MNRIELHGSLGSQFGSHFLLQVATPAEAFRALGSQCPGFYDEIRDGAYRIVRGDPDTGYALDAEELALNLGSRDLHIIPAVAGAKSNSSTGKIVIGIIIMVAAIYTGGAAAAAYNSTVAVDFGVMTASQMTVAGTAVTYGNIASFGLNMALNGVSQMLTRAPQLDSVGGFNAFEAPDQRPSFLFAGPVNVSHQGAAVPLVYGRMRTGAVVVSAGLMPEE